MNDYAGYADYADDYASKGWKPIPIERGTKWPPPIGTTGEDGTVTNEDIRDWIVAKPLDGLALRHEGTIAIDIDGYDGKPGPDTLHKIAQEVGEALPETYTSSSRGTESPSRQYFFRLPDPSIRLISQLPGIDICQYHHRYSVVAPSVHPKTGRGYEWAMTDEFGDSVLIMDAPAASELPLLPESWIQYLKDEKPVRPHREGFLIDTHDWFDSLNPGDPLLHVRHKVELSTQSGDDFNTQVMHQWVSYLVACGANGQPGIRALLDELRDRWLDLPVSALQPVSHYRREFDDSLRNAIRDIGPNKTPLEVPEGVNPLTGEIISLTPSAPIATSDAFWGRRDYLSMIERNSYRLMRSPWALLGVTLMRALACVPYFVRFESYMGDASFNALFAFVGRSSNGKSISHRNVSQMFDFGIRQEEGHLWPRTPGSDGAVADKYMKVNDKGEKDWQKDDYYRSIVWGFDEIVDLAASSERQGINLEGLMTKAWSGESIGRELASGRATTILQDEYRFTAYANVQPKMSGPLVNPRAQRMGFAGRWIWLDAQVKSDDLSLFDDETPVESMKIEIPAFIRGTETDVVRISALREMNRAFRDFERKRILEGDDSLDIDGHLLMTRVKVAAALMVLDGRAEFNSEDWELAGYVIDESVRVRQIAIDGYNEAMQDEDRAFGKRRAVQQDATVEQADLLAEDKLRRAYERIGQLLEGGRDKSTLKAKDFSAGYRSRWQDAVLLWDQQH